MRLTKKVHRKILLDIGIGMACFAWDDVFMQRPITVKVTGVK